jgi:hypothetical protein
MEWKSRVRAPVSQLPYVGRIVDSGAAIARYIFLLLWNTAKCANKLIMAIEGVNKAKIHQAGAKQKT